MPADTGRQERLRSSRPRHGKQSGGWRSKLRRSNTRRRAQGRRSQLHRMEVTSARAWPRLQVPDTARKRRRRNRIRLSLPGAAIKQVVLSSRWVSLVLLLLTASSLFLIGMDESFYLTTIPVEGVASIPPAEVVRMSGLGGAHIFAVEPRAAAERIAALPGVTSAKVNVEWPNKAHITIVEESPVAVWEQGGQQYWINEGGKLAPARIDVPGLLHIRSEEAGSPASATAAAPAGAEEGVEELTGTAAAASSSLLFMPQEVLRGALQLRELRPNIDALYYDTSGGLSYQDGRGWRAYFGTGTDMAQKLVIYETVVEKLLERGQTPVYISVSNQQRPFYLAQGGG